MWSYLPISSLIDMQRRAAVEKTGEQIRRLYEQGYVVDGDRLLDELGERMAQWQQERAA